MQLKTVFFVVFLARVNVCSFVPMTAMLTMIFCVHLGGASCQIEGREDQSCLGENQGSTGQKGIASSLLCTHALPFTDSVSLLNPASFNNCCLVIFTARCISL